MLRGRVIAGISSKSEVFSQLRAKEDSYTVQLKDGTSPYGPRARNSLFHKNGPWVHITVEYATSIANCYPLSLSNSFLRACMTRQHISEKKRRENCFDLKVWLSFVICIARHTEKQERVDLAN